MNDDLRKDFDECIALAIKFGRKYMPSTTKDLTTEEWALALLLFEQRLKK